MARTGLDEETRALIVLSLVPGVGSTMMTKLLAHFGSARACLSASERALQEAGLPARVVVGVLDARREGLDPTEEASLRDPELAFLRLDDPDYPRLLREIYDPPPLLYLKGTLRAEDDLAVTIVGTRKADPKAVDRAYAIARGLAGAGVTVVSGFAYGIDEAAHRGALDGGGRTLAVLACGLAHLYPNHPELAARIQGSGALLSELPMGVAAMPRNFPRRSRLLSGLSLITIIAQAPLRSGALHTARHALEQGREVFVVPGEGPGYAGSTRLIEDGAMPVTSAEEVLDALDRLPRPRDWRAAARPVPRKPRRAPTPDDDGLAAEAPVEEATAPALSGDEALVWEALSDEPTHIDALAQMTGLPVARLGSSLLLLEMKSLVRQFPGKRFAKKGDRIG